LPWREIRLTVRGTEKQEARATGGKSGRGPGNIGGQGRPSGLERKTPASAFWKRNQRHEGEGATRKKRRTKKKQAWKRSVAKNGAAAGEAMGTLGIIRRGGENGGVSR